MAIRSFIAIEIPEAVKRSIREVIESLKGSGADVKWVSGDIVHLTLKFLGDTDEALIKDIIEALNKKVSPYKPFCIKISGAGYFPKGRHPRVVWVGVEESARLQELFSDVEREMLKFGYPAEDRRFSPHLTMGRVRSQRKTADLIRKVGEYAGTVLGEVEVRGITLIKSELKPAGAEYTSLAEIPFSGRNNV